MSPNDLLLSSLRSAHLLPSPIIPATFTPRLDLVIAYPSGLVPQQGNIARVGQVSQRPRIYVSNPPPPESSNVTYTFMMIDPDAPTPEDAKYAYWRHWVVTSISGAAGTGGGGGGGASLDGNEDEDITARGTTLTPYLAPGPKDESGPHRYLFLLFEEKDEAGGLDKADVGGDEFVERRSFRAEEVVERKELKLVGVQWMRGVGDGWKGEEEKKEL
ncbi:phosphatidylethanolamine-binding [Pyrenophora seminiperda CCB06]|uniref:Phosphatidylethanolamine-binding n=1 Tax=Pyrenophora seminiperda CCB06 TaxID=1302712 RepID=A0A3M7M2R1_9PLEO|nr:phosphatidylethanolamine-binding [Pyrenophora seminiperda CCB06]